MGGWSMDRFAERPAGDAGDGYRGGDGCDEARPIEDPLPRMLENLLGFPNHHGCAQGNDRKGGSEASGG